MVRFPILHFPPTFSEGHTLRRRRRLHDLNASSTDESGHWHLQGRDCTIATGHVRVIFFLLLNLHLRTRIFEVDSVSTPASLYYGRKGQTYLTPTCCTISLNTSI